MIDLEQQLTDHLQRKAAGVTPRYDLDAVESGIRSVDLVRPVDRTASRASRGRPAVVDGGVGSTPERSRRRVWIQVAAAGLVVITGSIAVIAARGGHDQSISTAETDRPTNASVASSPLVTDGVPTVPPMESALVGIWVSTDGSSHTMEIVRSGGDHYELIYPDGVGACSGVRATISGTGRLEFDERLVITRPEVTCDGLSPSDPGNPVQMEFTEFTLELDPVTDELVDSFWIVWRRAGSSDEPIAPSPTTAPESTSPASGGMWPQTTLDEVRVAQARADAGEADYTWQLGTQLTLADPWANNDDLEIVGRFLREVLGWDAYIVNWHGTAESDGWLDGVISDLEFLRCVPGRTNPLYPAQPDEPGTLCAPTLDDFRYESVRLDLAQPVRQGLDGIWVVNQWTMTTPFEQADPAPITARATEYLDEWLAARIDGRGAEGKVRDGELLLYATTSGSPYGRYEIEPVFVGDWPDGRNPAFVVRLFADGGRTVVEQSIQRNPGNMVGEYFPMYLESTTENALPVASSRSSDDGEVTVAAPHPWGDGSASTPRVWSWTLGRELDDGPLVVIDFTDPVAYDAWCASLGGSPLLSAPADAAAIAQEIIADRNLETTAPVTVRVGGIEAISIDVSLAPGGKVPCGDGFVPDPPPRDQTFLPDRVVGRWIHELSVPGRRLRLYLLDLPEGMTVSTMAITVFAPEERFDEVMELTKPIIDSTEFHPR